MDYQVSPVNLRIITFKDDVHMQWYNFLNGSIDSQKS